MPNNINKKVNHIFELLKLLYNGEEIYAQNTNLQERLDVNYRTLLRYIEDIHTLYGNILITKKKSTKKNGRKVSTLSMPKKEECVSEVFRYIVDYNNDIKWLFDLIYDNFPTAICELSENHKEELGLGIKKGKDIFFFQTNPFEDTKNQKIKEHFDKLSKAVKNREYRSIEYFAEEKEILDDLKCLKLVFSHNNWYLAVQTQEGDLRHLRLSFIKRIYFGKGCTYNPEILDKYNEYFANMQNSFTKHNCKKIEAKLLASPKIAHYFKSDMKPLMHSQKYIETREDGSIVFSVKYTQSMEILPFIKTWLPDIKILQPKQLNEELKQDLLNYINQ